MSKSKNYILFVLAIVLMILFFDQGGITGKFFAGVIILIYFYLYYKDVTLAFALCAVVVANPYGLLYIFAFGFPKQLTFQTIFFLLSFLVIFSPQVTERRVDYNMKTLLPILFVFTLYQFVVSFLLKASPGNIKEISRYLFWQYPMYLGIYLVIPAYLVFKIDGKKFINAIVIASIVFTGLTLLNIYTSIHIFYVKQEFRNGAIRLFLDSSQLFKYTTLLAVVAFSYGQGKKYTHYYLSGIMAFLTILIGMYRLELMTNLAAIFFAIFLVSKYITRSLAGYFKFVKVAVIFIGILLVVSPHVYHAISGLYVKTYNEITGKGDVEEGTTQSRTIYELPNQLEIIEKHPILGIGWIERWWTNYTNSQDLGLTDIPVTATIAMYGMFGMLIYYTRYLYFLPLSKSVLSNIGKDASKIEKNEFHYILLLSLRAYFIMMITFRFFYVGWELTLPNQYGQMGVLLGVYFAVIYNVEHKNEGKQENYIL